MRFLVAFAILGYASASLIAPLAYHANAGDLQAAHIDAAVATQDHARAFHEGNTRAAEAAVQYNTEAVRQVAEANRDIHENSYWNGVAASQNLVAAAQSQAAALDGAAHAARSAYLAAPYVAAPYAAAPYAAAHYAAAPYAAAPYYAGHLGLAGVHAW